MDRGLSGRHSQRRSARGRRQGRQDLVRHAPTAPASGAFAVVFGSSHRLCSEPGTGVTVHAPGSSEGAWRRAKWAVTAVVKYSNTLRFCWRQVSTAVRAVSTNRLPAALWVPKLSFRQITAWRSDRSAALLVGSTPSTSRNVHSYARCWRSSRHMPYSRGLPGRCSGPCVWQFPMARRLRSL